MSANPLLLLHGALGSPAQFEALKSELGSGYTLYSPCFPGHGGRIAEGAFSIDRFVQETIEEMDSAKVEKADFFGYSMGGYVALRTAHRHPERVGRIMTLGTKFHWTPESAAKEVRMMDPEIIEQKIPAFADVLRRRHLPENWKTVMRKTADMMMALGQGLALSDDDFNLIDHQVLLCVGASDHMVSVEETTHTASCLPKGKCMVIDDFKHPLESVDTGVLAGILMDFIQ